MYKYILALKRSRYEDYLGFHSRVAGEEGNFVIIRAKSDLAQWQLGRLLSGLVAVPALFDTEQAARMEARQRTL